MASIIPGYEYDIFISYRQKDNKHDGWVTGFVDNLKGELEATFKEEISVYVDINPHDGLLETHDVGESLKEKLKCLVFIPIISRTYCDPKSFAWEHEFKAFVEQARLDKFGLKVKLPKGNVASRVLPIRIHDLDNEDIKLCESILGGVLRGVEFIYKEPGVNKPLTSNDNENKNLNNTNYRIQINKVANAIKEIISGLKTEPVAPVKEKSQKRQLVEQPSLKEEKIEQVKQVKLSNRKLLSGVAVIAILIIAAIFAYPKIFKQDTLEKLRSSGERISVVVMPFRNMTNDTIWNVWQDGIKDNLITYLSNFSEDLTVRQIESINGLLQNKGLTNYASITPSVASSISQKLDANIFISGSINKAGTTIRVNAQLINSKTEESFKSFQIEGTSEEEIFQIIDSLSVLVKDFLIISVMEKEIVSDFRQLISTGSSEAYRYYMYGSQALYKLDFPTAKEWCLKATNLDTNFTEAIRMLSYSYLNQGLYEEAKKWCLRLYEKKDQMSMQEKIWANVIYAKFFETKYEEIKYIRLLQDNDDQMPVPYSLIGNAYMALHQYDIAITEFEKELEIYDKWGSRPRWILSYTSLGKAYHLTDQYRKERKLYRKAEQDFPDNYSLLYRQAILAFTEDDTDEANRYIEKFISASKISAASEVTIASDLAGIYSEADIPDKAEEYYRKALSLEPEAPKRMNNLAWFLIDKDQDIEEGLKLVDKALELGPDNYNYLDCKGWGLYKQGNLEEALKLLNKSDSLKPIYNHSIYLHLEAAKKAVANQKKN